MDDYISREAALKAACEYCCEHDSCNSPCVEYLQVAELPAADVRPVVTCSKCKYNKACLLESFVRENSAIPFDEESWFCSDGERRAV